MKFIPLEVTEGEIFINPTLEDALAEAGVSAGDFFVLMKRDGKLVLSQPLKQVTDILTNFAKDIKL